MAQEWDFIKIGKIGLVAPSSSLIEAKFTSGRESVDRVEAIQQKTEGHAMPICILLVPEAASQEAKLALMGRLSSHIHEAYSVTTTHVFVRRSQRQQYNARRVVGERAPHY